MKRLFATSMLSLAIAGCAQSRSALTKGDGAPPPVAVTPVPSIYDSVNPGTGGPALARTAIKDPTSPQWSGRAPAPGGATSPGGSGAIAAAATSPPPAELNVQLPPTGRPMPGSAPAVTAAAPAVPAGAVQPYGGLTGITPAPGNAVGTTAAEPAATAAGGMPADSRVSGTQPPPAALTDNAVSPSASQSSLPPMAAPAPLPPITPAAGPRSQAPQRGRDPLLGADPDLMPPMPDLADVKSPAKPAASQAPGMPAVKPPGGAAVPPALDLPPVKLPALPATHPEPDLPDLKSPDNPPPLAAPEASATKSPASPAPSEDGLPLAPAPAAPAAVVPASDPAAAPTAGAAAATPQTQPADAGKSTAAREPASAGSRAALVALEPAPASYSVLPAVLARAAAPGPAPPRLDPGIVRTSAKPAAADAPERRRLSLEPGCPIARVGDEIITYHDLVHATRENLSRLSLPRGFDTAGQMELVNHINSLKIETLESLIDRSLLSQEARRNIKDSKMLAMVNEEADKIWHDNEILPLERKYNVTSEQQLKEKLAGQGRSLDTMRQSFRQMFLAETFIQQKLRDRVKVELPDLLRYYNEHVTTHEFDRPALIRWRELVVEVGKQESRAAARRKADGLLEALKRGEDLAKLARSQSDGPTGSRNRGGLMETSPGGYAVVPVNNALMSLPIGRVSGVIEGPQSFHIVKVENRRPAGPASFEEVQDRIKPIVRNQKILAERTAYINKLRRKTLITVYSAKKSAALHN